GHEDAKCVFYRQHRFRAIALPESVSENDLQNFKKSNSIASQDLAWEFPQKTNTSEALNFPVSKHHVLLQKARDSSDLLLKIPQNRSSWAYVSPKHDLEMIHFLESWD